MPVEQNHSSRFPLEPVTSPAVGFGPGLLYLALIPSCGVSLKSNQKLLGYFHSLLSIE